MSQNYRAIYPWVEAMMVTLNESEPKDERFYFSIVDSSRSVVCTEGVLCVMILQQILLDNAPRQETRKLSKYEMIRMIRDNMIHMMHDDMLSADIILHAGLVRLNPKFLRASWR